jgi:hypothetical protein
MKSCIEVQAKKLSTQKSDGKMSFVIVCKSFWPVTMLIFSPKNIFLLLLVLFANVEANR